MKNKKEEHTKFGIYYDDDYDYLQHLREVRNTVVHWEQAPDKPVKVSVEIFIREDLKSKSRDFFLQICSALTSVTVLLVLIYTFLTILIY